MEFDLQTLFPVQRNLDEKINKEKGLEGKDNLAWKILALQVETGECANEWRGFKKWSEDQKPRYEKVNVCPKCRGNRRPFGIPEETGIDCEKCDGSGLQVTFPLKEEYVDGLPFVLSIGLELGYDNDKSQWAYKDITQNSSIESQFIWIYLKAGSLLINRTLPHYAMLVSNYIGLGKMLNFTWEEIVEAYHDKNKINHQRQANGY
jgi:dimeric dUTPase (all-alpha-NTP-PPase superfamily)